MKTRLKSLLILLVVITAIAGFFWLANFLGSGEKAESEKAIVICKPIRQTQGEPQNAPPIRQAQGRPEKQECLWTAHIHATVKVFMKGEEVALGFEQGELEGQHTHAEKNKLHWHGLIPVDSKTKEITDWSVLEVSKIALGPQEGNREFVVNGKEVEPSYIWKDGDVIEIRYE